MKTLSILGTAAMFLVGGGILVHGVPGAQDLLHVISQWPMLVSMPAFLSSGLFNAIVGLVAGGIAVMLVSQARKILPASR